MTPIEAAGYFATIVGLICNWKADRGAAATDKFNDFLNYLTVHNFQILSSQITESADLQRDLRELLEHDFQTVGDKLDAICQGLSSLSEKVEAFAPLVHTLKATNDALSQQAIDVLKIFEQTESSQMIMFRDGEAFGLLPGGGSFSGVETRFIEDDLAMLVGFGLLKLSNYNSAGDPIYTITRQGVSFVKDRPEIKSPEGKLIGAQE